MFVCLIVRYLCSDWAGKVAVLLGPAVRVGFGTTVEEAIVVLRKVEGAIVVRFPSSRVGKSEIDER